MAIDVNISGLNTVVDVTMDETALIDADSGQVIVIEDYDNLSHKPQINGVTLSGNKTSSQVGVADAVHTHTKSQITDFPTIPTDTSDLTNGAGFITSSDIPVTDVTLDGTSVVSSGVAALTTPTIHNVPSGGASGEVLAKASATDYDLTWVAQSGGGASAFEAEFGTTTYADVKDAYDDNAILICTVPDGDNTMTLQLVYFDDTNEIFFFAFPTSDGWYWTQLSNADGWDDGQFYFASTDVATQLADGLMSALDKQKLDGLSKRNIWYGTSSTSASSSPKSITTASGDFSLTAGNMLVVLFSHTNSLSSVSLQVDGGASKSAYSMDGTSDISNRWGSNEVVSFVYDGTKFVMLEQGLASTTQYGITKLNNTVTSTSTSEAATANAVKSAYDHGGVTSFNGSTGAITYTAPVTSVNGNTGAVTVTVPTITDTYDGTSSDGMSGKAVKGAIDALDGTVSGSAGSGKTLTAFSQTDGKVSATFGNISITKSQVSDFPTIPTNVSDLNNDSGFTATSITRYTTTGTNIADLTIDGTTTKLYAPTGGGGGGITDVTVDGTSVVSGTTAAIDLTGKSDVGHTHTTSAITDFPALATVATSGDYDDLTDKPTIPSNVSDLVNDSGFITSPNVVYCTCSTASGTAAKVATIESGSLTTLNKGDQAIVKFTNANGVASPTLQIGTTTAKSIKRYGTTAPSTSAATSWNAGSAVYFVYDGTYWQQIGFLNTTYSEISQANITNGSGSTTGLVTGRRAKAAVEAFAPIQDVTVGGTSVMSGTTAVVPAIPTVPTNVSDFVNDAGYLTSESDPIFTASDAYGITSSDISNWNGKAEISDIPTDTADLTNSAGYITGVTSTSTPTASTISEFDASSHINSADMSAQDVSDFVDSLTPSGSKISDWELLDSATFTAVNTITHTLNDVDTASITDFFITGACLSATIPKCGGRTSFSATGYYYVSSQYTLRIYFDIAINSATQLTIRYRLEAKGSSDSYPTYQLYYRHKES